MHIHTLTILLALGLSTLRCGAQPIEKPEQEWQRATEIAERERESWREVFESLDVASDECEAVVFPELLRYTRLQNGMEQAALHAFYISGGKEAANFSVGLFQMKPSFAEEVESEWMRSPLRREYSLYFDTSDTKEARRRRIERLADSRWQCVYLALFVRLLSARLPQLATLPVEERVALMATAYNMDFGASFEQLQAAKDRRSFHLDFLASKRTTYYGYAILAAEWYKTLSQERQ